MTEIGATLQLGLGLIMFWLLYFLGWRPYRIDRVRHELFELRNELFLYGLSGEISFENDAYRMLRVRIEALIRFAHIMTLTRVIFIGIQQQIAPISAFETRQKAWETAFKGLPDPAQKKLQDIHNRVYLKIMEQMVSGNLLLLTLAAISSPFFYLKSWLESKPNQEHALKVARELRVQLIEEQAVLCQQQELVPA